MRYKSLAPTFRLFIYTVNIPPISQSQTGSCDGISSITFVASQSISLVAAFQTAPKSSTPRPRSFYLGHANEYRYVTYQSLLTNRVTSNTTRTLETCDKRFVRLNGYLSPLLSVAARSDVSCSQLLCRHFQIPSIGHQDSCRIYIEI